jgi:hypothetical protein
MMNSSLFCINQSEMIGVEVYARPSVAAATGFARRPASMRHA